MASYLLKSEKMQGEFLVHYENGNLNSVKLDFKSPLNIARCILLLNHLPEQEDGLPELKNLGLNVIQQIPVNEKLAWFCEEYEKKVGIKYKVSPADIGKMKILSVDRTFLVHYFNSDNWLFKGKWSVNNLAKYFNEARADYANEGKSSYPDSWSKEVEDKLSQAQVAEYWAHLRSLGLVVKKDRLGRTLDWIKKV